MGGGNPPVRLSLSTKPQPRTAFIMKTLSISLETCEQLSHALDLLRLDLRLAAVEASPENVAESDCPETVVVDKTRQERESQLQRAFDAALNDILETGKRYAYEEDENGNELKLSSPEYLSLCAALVHGQSIVRQLGKKQTDEFHIQNEHVRKYIVEFDEFTSDDGRHRPTTQKEDYAQKYLHKIYELWNEYAHAPKACRKRKITMQHYLDLVGEEFPGIAAVFVEP